MKLSNQKKEEVVARITKSNTFKNAPTSIALLLYLFEATQKNTPLKESIIDIDFFGGFEISNKNNPRVRVNVYNLRKKLDAFYTDEGKNEEWILQILKGQYNTSFIQNENKKNKLKKINWKIAFPYFGLVCILLFLLINSLPNKSPELWKPFLENHTKTKLFIGDHFGISGKTITNKPGWTRDFNINSSEDFYTYIDKNPELKNKIKPSTYSYSTRMSALATQKFQSFFQFYKSSFDIRFSTQTSIPEIKEGNIIYVGPTKNKNLFLKFFNEGNPYCKIINDDLIISKPIYKKDSIISIKSPKIAEEYAVVSRYKSIGNTEHFVFFSQHDIGVSATVDYFLNKDSLQVFSDKYLKGKKHFTAIFKVKGVNRTETDLKILDVIPF
ncbi:hypothetical protein BW723_04345 [Polaribacter reichenbachii]|uniref:Uncharacterized protein n=1 Tax=Polaribacter reichenbachii TaxID=996801 RepID=A0A1B8TV16_9FLAO|nr:hypothetical protein [Polaribacter reichenbachii]APZ45571.1 hypothetical protein BW723_04345 [Polaribacter reichenbachii]AUC19433.1 hypothetical protein BTO17_12350 [Polaribacter reichenbachii]OBY63412.1 hypothetical protein LPB301_11365 [Polaribacter reichenbachii]